MRDLLFGAARPMTSLKELPRGELSTLKGTAVMLAASTDIVPPVLSQLIDRFKVVHERILILNVVTEGQHRVPKAKRATVRQVDGEIYQATLRFGFMEEHDVPRALARGLKKAKLGFTEKDVTYFLRRENVVAGPRGKMGRIAESIFAFLHRNASSADGFFCLPPDRVVELGWQLDL